MTHPNQPSLEDVLDMLLVTYGGPTPEAIADFAERFPAYRSNLFEFAVDWTEEEHLPEPGPLNADQEAVVFARAQSAFQNAAFEQTAAASQTAATARLSLAQLARAAGKSLDDVVQAAGLDHTLISKLNGRRIRPTTIRAQIARKIAAFLRVPESQVVASWTGPPHSLAMSFHAKKAPVPQHQEDFDIAVAKSSLSPEEKAALLMDD
jgi:hypothetical protein